MRFVQPFLRAASTGAAISGSRLFPQTGFIESRRHCHHSVISDQCSPLLMSESRYHYLRQNPSIRTNKIGSLVTLFSTKSSETIQPELPPSEKQEFASSYHAPVMYKECIDAMLKRSHNESSKKNKYRKQSKVAQQETERHRDELTYEQKKRPRIFVDGTLGGGGHSLCLLQNLSPGDILIGCDVDPSALATASTRLKDFIISGDQDGEGGTQGHDNDRPIFIPVQSNFRDLYDNVQDLKHPITGERLFCEKQGDGESSFVGADAILLDLGISSHQIDNADRGFAFMKDGPLDMRMWGGEWNNQAGDGEEQTSEYTFVRNKSDGGIGGMTAADICNEFGEEEIIRILKIYGDEPRARRIAASIVDARPLSTTDDLRKAVAKVTPEFAKKGRRMGRTATLARVFQALRIVVNEEDVVLRDALEIMAPSLIRKGGRLVVLSYHSMEDRATKRVMRDGTIGGSRRSGGSMQKDMFGNEIVSEDGTARPWKTLGKRAKATEAEIEVNSRARSATLRVAKRL